MGKVVKMVLVVIVFFTLGVFIGKKVPLRTSDVQVFDNTVALEKMVYPTVQYETKTRYGSAVLVGDPDNPIVVTCAHIFTDFREKAKRLKEGAPIRSVFSGQYDVHVNIENTKQTFKAIPFYIDSEYDFSLSILDLGAPSRAAIIPTAKLSPHPPKLTEKIYSVGYPINRPDPHVTEGIVSFLPQRAKVFGISTPIISGNSGGPIFLARNHKIVGIVSSVAISPPFAGSNPVPYIAHAVPSYVIYAKLKKIGVVLD